MFVADMENPIPFMIRYKEHLLKDSSISQKTVAGHLDDLRTVFRFGLKNKKIPSDPLVDVTFKPIRLDEVAGHGARDIGGWATFPTMAGRYGLPDGNPHKIPWMGTLSGIEHPLSPASPFHPATSSATHQGGRDRRASCALRSGGSFHQFRSPFSEGRGVSDRGWNFVMNRRTEVSRLHLGVTEETPRGPEISRDMSRFSGWRFALRPILQVCQWEVRLPAVLWAP